MPSDDSEHPRPRGAYAKGIARRQEILDRAIEVFAARGADRTSLRAIAKEVGVTHAALTYY
ncbi:helix-turn-helix domain-containing protein, partial [Xanthomonas oryzae]